MVVGGADSAGVLRVLDGSTYDSGISGPICMGRDEDSSIYRPLTTDSQGYLNVVAAITTSDTVVSILDGTVKVSTVNSITDGTVNVGTVGTITDGTVSVSTVSSILNGTVNVGTVGSINNLVDGTVKIWDGVDDLDVVDRGDPESTGLLAFGADYDQQGNSSVFPIRVDDSGYQYFYGTVGINGTVSALTDGTVKIWDGTQDLDVTTSGSAVSTGLSCFGKDISSGLSESIPLHQQAFASANYDLHYPVGGLTYPPAGNHAAYAIRIDSGGYQHCKISDGTDLLDVVVSGDVPSNGIIAMALNTSPAPDVAAPLVIHAEGVQTTRDYSLPVGGTDYGAPDAAYTIKVDNAGGQYITDIANITDGYIRVWDGTTYAEVTADFLAVTQDERKNGLFVTSGNYGLYAAAAAGVKSMPLIVDLDDNAIANSQVAQVVIPLLYGYDSAGAAWERLLADGNGNLLAHITDGTSRLDIVPAGAAVTTGIVTYGSLGVAATTIALPIDISAAQANAYHIPIGGLDYRGVNAYELDVDTGGRISVRDLGTDRDDVRYITRLDGPSKSLTVNKAKKEIYSNDYLLWFDDCETKSGAGLTVNKWIPGLSEMPFNQGVGTSFINYVQGGQSNTVPPKEGDWMLELANTHPTEGTGVGCDAYTKLGEIDEKRVSLELWFTGVSVDAAYTNDTTFAMGFYQFYTNALATQSTMRTFIVRLFIPGAGLPRWEYWNNAGGWTDIDDDPRQIASVKFGDWNANDVYCWHYAKLTINLDYENDGTYNYESFTVDDTTWEIDAACNETALAAGTDKSALCPYVYGRAPATLAYGDDFKAETYVDCVKVYANDMQEYGPATSTFGQKAGPGA